MKITLKDGSFKEYENSKSVIEIAADISEGLARVATAGEIDGEVVDLRTVVDKDCELNILTFNDEKGKGAFRHTASHIMAQAVKRLYPETKLAIGPSVADGFYYDVDRETPFTADDLEKIEKEMKKIVKENLPIEQFTKPRNEAIEYFKEKEEPYKVELIEDLPEDETISFYSQGEFTDLCAGPHLMSTKYVKAFKLTSLAGAYWRGSEKNKMLQRIYGTAFPKKAELEEYLNMLEEAKKRDHRKLGKELGLFMMRDEGPGFPFFLPNGMVLKNVLLDYWREIHRKAGYVEISTPVMLSRHLWETSGHWDHYKENMYTTVIDEEDFAIKPMSAPLTNQPMLELCFAIALPSLGSAILFNIGSSSGGTDIIAMILKKYSSVDIGHALLITDVLITVAGCFMFDIATGLYSFLGLAIRSFMIDTFIESFNLSKYFNVVCDNPKPICDFIVQELNRSATVCHAQGAFSGKDKYVIFTALNRPQAVRLRNFIKDEEPSAFILISNTSEIIGKGFHNV